MHRKEVIRAGKRIEDAKQALILLHGRGATAHDILGLADQLSVGEFALLAPQATNHTWYPFSFLAPPAQNEPWLTSAIALLNDLVSEINSAGISSQNIFFTGFSQGACLTLEFVARNARTWGGVAAFTGGLIGDRLYRENYQGDFAGTRIFIGTGDPDTHVPVTRVRESADVLRSMNADVTLRTYPLIGHTITYEELKTADELIFAYPLR